MLQCTCMLHLVSAKQGLKISRYYNFFDLTCVKVAYSISNLLSLCELARKYQYSLFSGDIGSNTLLANIIMSYFLMAQLECHILFYVEMFV